MGLTVRFIPNDVGVGGEMEMMMNFPQGSENNPSKVVKYFNTVPPCATLIWVAGQSNERLFTCN